jgi:hypothetical protein
VSFSGATGWTGNTKIERGTLVERIVDRQLIRESNAQCARVRAAASAGTPVDTKIVTDFCNQISHFYAFQNFSNKKDRNT